MCQRLMNVAGFRLADLGEASPSADDFAQAPGIAACGSRVSISLRRSLTMLGARPPAGMSE
jgi:hypothetical protein